MNMIRCFNAAKNHSNKNLVRGPFILGDFNARHTAWGDITPNEFGKILLDFCGSEGFVSSRYEPTFVKSHVNDGSVID